MIRILYFARIREALGVGEEQLDATPESVAVLLNTLMQRGDDWREALSGRVLCAVNQQMAQPSTQLQDGDEVGLFPPVSGG